MVAQVWVRREVPCSCQLNNFDFNFFINFLTFNNDLISNLILDKFYFLKNFIFIFIIIIKYFLFIFLILYLIYRKHGKQFKKHLEWIIFAPLLFLYIKS